MANGFNNIKIHSLDSLACPKINTQFLRVSESTLVGFSGILSVPTVLQLQTHSHL